VTVSLPAGKEIFKPKLSQRKMAKSGGFVDHEATTFLRRPAKCLSHASAWAMMVSRF
jgi:hypothetical protein